MNTFFSSYTSSCLGTNFKAVIFNNGDKIKWYQKIGMMGQRKKMMVKLKKMKEQRKKMMLEQYTHLF